MGDCAKLEFFRSRGHSKLTAQFKQSGNSYAHKSEFSGADKPIANNESSECSNSVASNTFEPTRHGWILFGDLDSNQPGRGCSKSQWPAALLSGEQWLGFLAGHDPESFELPERTGNSKQAAKHAPWYHCSGKQHAVHGCGRHSPDTRVVFDDSTPGGKFDESRNNHADPGHRDAQSAYGHSKPGDCDSKSEYGNAEHGNSESRDSVNSRHRQDCSNDSEFADQRHAFRSGFYTESRYYKTAWSASGISDLRAGIKLSYSSHVEPSWNQAGAAWEPCHLCLLPTSNSSEHYDEFPIST